MPNTNRKSRFAVSNCIAGKGNYKKLDAVGQLPPNGAQTVVIPAAFSTARSYRLLLLTTIALLLATAPAVGANLQTLVVSQTQPSSATCTEPPAATTFATTTADIFEYFVIQNMNAGDKVSVDWVAPNQSVRTTLWYALAAGGNYCWTGALLPQSVFSNLPGNWQLQVYLNGEDIGQTSFTVTAPAGPPTTSSTVAAPRCGSFSDPTNIYPCCANGGNCTWWAWYQAQVNWGVNLPNWGNANNWWANASRSGYSGSSIPAVNTIAVNTTVNGTGHVAWVTQVNADGSVVVSEMNCNLSPSQQFSKTYPANWFTSGGGGFIYPRGTEGVPVITSMYPSAPRHSSTNSIATFYGVNLNYPRSAYVTFPNGAHAILSGSGQIPFYSPNYVQVNITLNASGWWSIQFVNYDGGTSAPYRFYVQ